MPWKRSLLWFSILVVLSACGKKDSTSIPWPQKPDNGAPVAFEFLGIDGAGESAQARIRLFNFDERNAINVVLFVRYLDDAGKELRSTPINFASKSGIVKGKKHTDKKLFGKLPEGTARVTAEVRKVELDGGEWLHPEGIMPAIRTP